MARNLAINFARGALWLGISSVTARVFGLLAQIILGAHLTDSDFGVFAHATGITALTLCLRGGNVAGYLQNLTDDRFKTEAGGYIRLSGLACLIGLTATLSAAGAAPFFSAERDLPAVLAGFALIAIAPFYAMPPRARLAGSLSFGRLACVEGMTSLIRASTAIALALGGLGIYALVIPVVVAGWTEVILLRCLMPVATLRMAMRATNTCDALKTTFWTTLGAVTSTVIYQGDYLAASFFVSTEVLGQYFFAYALCNQLGYFSVSMLGKLVAPIISKLDVDERRQARTADRIAASLALIMPAILMTLPIAFPELDNFLWGGRWENIRSPLLIISTHLGCLLTTTVLYGVLHGRGDFRKPALLEFIRALALLTGVAVGAALLHSPTGIGLGALLLGGSSSVFISILVTRAMGKSAVDSTLPLIAGPVIGLGVAKITRHLFDALHGWSGATTTFDPRWCLEAAAVVPLFLFAYFVVIRITFPKQTEDILKLIRQLFPIR